VKPAIFPWLVPLALVLAVIAVALLPSWVAFALAVIVGVAASPVAFAYVRDRLPPPGTQDKASRPRWWGY
jgi:hypothetical protein